MIVIVCVCCCLFWQALICVVIWTVIHNTLSFSCRSVSEQGPSAPPESSGASPQPQPQQQRVPIHKPFTQSRVPPDLPMHPAPRHITEEELHVLEGCLHRWRSEVENDTRGAVTYKQQKKTTHTFYIRFKSVFYTFTVFW